MAAERERCEGLSIRAWFGLAALSVLLVAALGYFAAQRSTRLAMHSVGRVETRFEPLARLARDLEDSIVAYYGAVSAQLKFESEQNEAAVPVASAQLAVALAEYRRIAGAAPLQAARFELEEQVAALQRGGEQLTAAQQQRRRAIATYWSALERMRNRILRASTGHLDAAGTGLVMSRKSLADLARAAAAIGGDASAQFTGGTPQAALAAVRDEERFRAVLIRHRAELRQSPGRVWLELLQEDFAALVRARRLVARIDADFEPQRRAFTDAAQELRREVQEKIGQPAWRALAESARNARVTAQAAERTIAAVSIVVLMLVLALWAAAARGVTRPVRRLHEATRRLAAGALETRVTRGGVRELDELASSFNHMASQLAESERAVREHRTELERRVSERTRQLHHLAHHDPLTELPNRRQLFAHLEGALGGEHGGEQRLALLFIDLDNFKTINDSLGHQFGDQVLRAVAARLQQLTVPGDFVGRLGGDEFTLVLSGAGSVEEAEKRVAQLLAEFQRPLVIEQRELLVGLSVGVALHPEHAESAEALLRAADSALGRAKELGRNRWCTYSPELFAAASERFQTEQALRRAIDSGDLMLYYQPEVSLLTRETTIVEALMRWRLPDGRLASAGEFLGVAEQSGVLIDLGDWVLAQAAAAVGEWRRSGWPQARVSINASAQQFLGGGFIASIERLLLTSGLPPECLELELTETALQTGAVTIEALQALRELGLSVALDDFGAGFSSLSSIEKLPLSRVKLDRSLIAAVDSNPRSAAIARSIVTLCRGLGLEVTAEGVERPTQLEFLASCGDVQVQGYLIARPAPGERIVGLVQGTRAQLALLGPSVPSLPEPAVDVVSKLIPLRARRS